MRFSTILAAAASLATAARAVDTVEIKVSAAWKGINREEDR